MFELTVEGSFAAAHRLPAHRGKCRNLHGHTYRVRVTVAGATLDAEQGYLVDFGVVKGEVAAVLERFDHTCLNDLAPFAAVPPTVEHLARVLFDDLSPRCPGLSSVTVFESDRAWVTYRREPSDRA